MAGLLLLSLLLVVPPLVLLETTRWPIEGMPTAEQVQAWVAKPLTQRTLTAGLTLLAWLIWLFVAYTAVVAAARRVRSGARWLRRLPLPTPLQATATSVAGAAALGGGHVAAAQPAEPVAPVIASTVDGSPISPDTADVGEGVTVAGGWLPRETAEQVAAASVLVWLRRRRDYQPLTGSEPPHHDLAPLPQTVAAVRAALNATTHADDPAGRPPPGEVWAAGTLTVLPPAVALTGPGALHAGRGVLVTTLLAALRRPADGTPTVITRAALTMLFGPAPTVALQQGLPGLQVTASLDDALTLVHRTAHKMLLISETVPAPAGSRLAVMLDAGTVSAVVLGTSPVGAAWHVDVHGYTSEAGRPQESGARLCVLDQVAATDLLAVLTLTQSPPGRRLPDITVVPRPRPPADPVTLRATAAEAAEPAPPIHLRVLGKPAVLVDGQPVTIRRSAAWQGVILLAVYPEGLGARQLTDTIWPGIPAHTVTGRLYTTLSDLRRTIGAAAIHHRDDRYRLDPDHVDVDLWHLRAAAHRAATALTDHTRVWQKVIDTYTGDLAAGHTWAWVDLPREATRRLVIDAYAASADAQSDPQRALELLEAALRVDPYNAHLHRRAVDALTALGDHSGAAQLLHRYTHRLADAGLAPISLGQTTPSSR